ncbi:12308_t:CDS:2 [Funneliformis caledonium]|uniref:12308_t:CDS:1 n=1 Tax=Funneliformis caledonium TaxID=1117310 RepID=A0A9N9CFD4_9GLOM|nr:12308_t:CDS:2 [Funneliformis caledonium]
MNVEYMKKKAQALELLLRLLPEDCYRSCSINDLRLWWTGNSWSIKMGIENSRDDMPTSVFLITVGKVYIMLYKL